MLLLSLDGSVQGEASYSADAISVFPSVSTEPPPPSTTSHSPIHSRPVETFIPTAAGLRQG